MHYNFWRPLTAIREDDGNPATESDSEWKPFVNTPNYPDYTSGCQRPCGAFTKTMELFFGRDNIPLRHHEQRTDRHQEVAHLRQLLGGFAASRECPRSGRDIHFRFADVEARKQGRDVAEYAYDHYLLPVSN